MAQQVIMASRFAGGLVKSGVAAGQTLLRTFTITNTSGSAQASGTVLKPKGITFPRGVLGGSDWPQFKVDGIVCGVTIFGKSTWDDGSWAFCGVIVRMPVAVAGSGTKSLLVYSGGSAPGSAAVGTADITATDHNIELVGVTNLSGTWTSSVNQGITDGDVTTWANGDAGKIVIVDQGFMQTGADHGQVWARHYIQILQDASGTLAGQRYLGRANNGFAATTSPTPTRRAASGSYKQGASTIRSFSGYNTTEVLGSTIGMPHAAGFFTAATDAQWDFVAGTQAAETTLRITHSLTEELATQLHPPFDTSLTITSNASQDYVPMGNESLLTYNMDTTGDRAEIGVYTDYSARHFFNQAANDERVIRGVGLVTAGWRTTYRTSAARQIVPLDSGSYTGLPASQPTWQAVPGACIGYANATDETSPLWAGEFNTSHRPSTCYYPYLVTAEPHFLDMLVEYTNAMQAQCTPGNNTFASSPVTGSCFTGSGQRGYVVGATTYECAATINGSNLSRIAAWYWRDLAQCWRALPDTDPFGTQVKTYFRNCLNNSVDMLNAYNASMPSSWQNSGLYYFRGTTDVGEPAFALGYLWQVAAHCESLTNFSNAGTLRDHFAKYLKTLVAIPRTIAAVCCFDTMMRDDAGTRVEDINNVAFDYAHGLMSWTIAGNLFTVGSGGEGNFDYTPVNGDLIGFRPYFSANVPFASTPEEKLYECINVSGQTFQLANRGSGTPNTVTSNNNVLRMWASTTNPPATGTGYQGSDLTNLIDIRAALRFLQASGATGMSSAATAMNALYTTSGAVPADTPKWAYGTSF